MRVLPSLLAVFLMAVGGAHALLVVNNVTVSSDVLSDLFFDAIRNNKDLLAMPYRDTKEYNSTICLRSLLAMVNEFPSIKVLPFFDSWGKFPSGILYGSFYDVGNYDQCATTSATLNSLADPVSGQFCFATIPFNQRQQEFRQKEFRRFPVGGPVARDGLLDYMFISIGICVPDSCEPELLTTVMNNAIGSTLGVGLSGVTVSQCTNGKRPDFDALDIVGITIFSIFAGLMVISSVYDFLMGYFEKRPVPLLLAFSVLTNGKKLFAINTTKSPNTIDCLTGIRVFSMMWVMYAHTYGFTTVVPLINTIKIFSWFKAAWSLHVIDATVSVDSFFFISGVLVAWLGFRELDRRNGKLSIVMMYVHRYIRLTPPVAAGILFTFTAYKYIGNGPFKQAVMAIEQCNGNNWWPVLLYIQNYYVQDTACYPQTWYLAIDFQLYILSPLLLIPMWKWRKRFAPALIILSLLSIGCVIATYVTEGYTDLKGMDNPNEWVKVSTPTHTRYSPWLVGFGLGYFMYVNRQKTFRLSKLVQLIGWSVCFISIVSILFAPYFTLHNRGTGTVFEAAMYEGFKRVSWAIALAWITFACQFGFGGVVNTFLSHPFWQPLGRLTYSLYLVHMFVLLANLGMNRTEMYFSDYTEILRFWSTFGVSLCFAIVATLAFESPVLILEKVIFGRGKTKKDAPAQPTAPPQDVVVKDL